MLIIVVVSSGDVLFSSCPSSFSSMSIVRFSVLMCSIPKIERDGIEIMQAVVGDYSLAICLLSRCQVAIILVSTSPFTLLLDFALMGLHLLTYHGLELLRLTSQCFAAAAGRAASSTALTDLLPVQNDATDDGYDHCCMGLSTQLSFFCSTRAAIMLENEGNNPLTQTVMSLQTSIEADEPYSVSCLALLRSFLLFSTNTATVGDAQQLLVSTILVDDVDYEYRLHSNDEQGIEEEKTVARFALGRCILRWVHTSGLRFVLAIPQTAVTAVQSHRVKLPSAVERSWRAFLCSAQHLLDRGHEDISDRTTIRFGPTESAATQLEPIRPPLPRRHEHRSDTVRIARTSTSHTS